MGKRAGIGQELLGTASALLNGDRQAAYGCPKRMHDKIASIWSIYLGAQLDGDDVAMMMILMKVLRNKNARRFDNMVDVAGYAAIAGDFIHPVVKDE